MLRKSTTLGACIAFASAVWAQCTPGNSAVTITVDTDGWGYEVYWEVVDAGDACGTSTWAFGGNSDDVGCDGNGNGGGSVTYASNAVITEGPYCLPTDSAYDFIHIDDYGDGGTHFEIVADGIPIASYAGTGAGNVWTFSPGTSNFVEHDSPCGAAWIEVDGDTLAMSTVGATAQIGEPSPDANPLGGCGAQGWWCGSDGNVARSVWLSFTAPTSDPVTINTCIEGTTMDTQLALYAVGSCDDWSTFELIGASDDIPGGCGPGNGYASFLYSDCLEAGTTYWIQLDGWGGSTGTALVAVESNPLPTPNLNVLSSNIDCPLSEEVVADGEILATLNGGGADFTCTIDGPSGVVDGPYASGLWPGEYTVEVATSCGTAFTDVVTITAPASFQLAVESVDPSCEGAGDGSIAATLTGGTEPYEWAWSNADGFTASSSNLTGLQAGWYDLEITDDAGCAFAGGVELLASEGLAFSLGPDTLICLGQTLLLYGPPALNYVWQDGSINQFLYIEASEWGTGTYPLYLTVSNDEGCEASDVFILTIGSCTVEVAEADQADAQFFPNPATDEVQWKLPAGAHSGQILDAQGRTLTQLNGQSGELAVAAWPVGMYWVQYVSAQGELVTERLQIVH